MVLEKMFEDVPYISLCETKFAPGQGQFDPGGHDFNNLFKAILGDALCQISKLWASWLWRRRYLNEFPIYPYVKTKFAPGQSQFDPGGHDLNNLGKGPKGDASRQISKLWASGFWRRKFLKVFPIYPYVKLSLPCGRVNLTPVFMIWKKNFVEVH